MTIYCKNYFDSSEILNKDKWVNYIPLLHGKFKNIRYNVIASKNKKM